MIAESCPEQHCPRLGITENWSTVKSWYCQLLDIFNEPGTMTSILHTLSYLKTNLYWKITYTKNPNCTSSVKRSSPCNLSSLLGLPLLLTLPISSIWLWTLYKWIHTMCFLLCLASFTQHNVCKHSLLLHIAVVCSLCCYKWYSFVWISTIYF